MKARYSTWKGGLVICRGATSQRETACGVCHELAGELDSDREWNQGHVIQAEPISHARTNVVMNQESK